MTLGFLALRKGFLKVTGAVIQAALDRGHEVVLLWDPVEAKLGEQVSRADLDAWPPARIVEVDRRTPLLPALRSCGVTALVGPSLYTLLRAFGWLGELDALAAAGVRLYSVDYALDTVTNDPAGYTALTTTFYTSEWQRQLHWRVRQEDFARLGDQALWRARSAVVGSTMLDQLGVVDRAAVRKRYGLDDRPVVLFLSLKMLVADKQWRRLHWGTGPRAVRALRAVVEGQSGWVPSILRDNDYRALFEAVRRLCVRSGAALVVKSREKNGDPAFLRRRADAFITDESVYPYTSMELMAIADLCVHFQSAGVLEAAFAGVPSLSVKVAQEHLRASPTYDAFYAARPDTPLNFPGVVWSVTLPEAIARLETATLDGFRMDAERRRAYVEQFMGFDDTRASARVLDAIDQGNARTAPSGPASAPA
jgi:hypothetical protein